MISIKFRGNLGNQLFEIASLSGIAKGLNTTAHFPEWGYSKYFTNKLLPIERNLPEINEPYFHYGGWVRDNRNYIGWLQSEKYFNGFNFDFEPVFKESIRLKYKPVDCIAISVRRGDYIGNPNYELLPIEYYLGALQMLPSEDVIIFSDDPAWCRLQFPDFYICDAEPIEQICLMSLCSYHIISNSTFAWWGAYLSDSKKVIRPSVHFDGLLKRRSDIKDYYPESWQIFDHRFKFDLSDVTFTIPVKYDSGDREENLILNLNFLNKYFKTTVIIGEQGGSKFKDYPAHYADFNDLNTFHRTRMLNEMAGMAVTPIIVNWDADVFLSVYQILKSVKLIRDGVDMVYPYAGKMARVPRAEKNKVHDVGLLTSKYRGTDSGDQDSVGGAVFFNKKSFISGGMENENYISYGNEDVERYYRFNKLGFKIERVAGHIYHLDHEITLDSSTKHKYFNDNEKEWQRIKKMNADSLREYVNSFAWLKNYS